MRVGLGYDIHTFGSSKPLFIGGIEISHPKGFVAHSDGDVLLHALIDALLGAAGLPDIGEQFPDTSPEYKDISSLMLLEITLGLVRQKGFTLCNADLTVIAEEPKLSPYKAKIAERVARAMEIDKTRVTVKAKTNEKVGAIGSGQAVAAYAVVLLEEK